MIWSVLFFLSTLVMANTFKLTGTDRDFALVISARVLSYTSDLRNHHSHIKPCNLPLVRALNAELSGLVPAEETKEGALYQVDGNTYHLASKDVSSGVLEGMDERMKRFQEEETKACD